MREKTVLIIPAAVRDPGLLKAVDQREHNVVVPEEDCGLIAPDFPVREDIIVLRLSVFHRDQPDRQTALPGGPHGLRMPEAVLHDKSICGFHNLRRGAVVFFNQKLSGSGVIGGEGHQRIRKRGPEGIDALILIPDHEEVFIPGGEQADDLVLDFGGVLGLIHAEVTILFLKIFQNIGKAAQQRERIDHLVVVVHLTPAPQFRLIAAVELRKAGNGPPSGGDLLLGEHHVLDEGDRGADFAQGGLFGIFPVDGLIQRTQNPASFPVLSEQGKGFPAQTCGGIGDEFGRDAVDGTKLQTSGQLFAEEGGKTAAHIPRGGPGIGHGQNPARVDPAAEHHITQTNHQNGGFSAAGGGKQQYRPLHREHRFPLLGIQAGQISGFKLR